jgi:hypothetical protein
MPSTLVAVAAEFGVDDLVLGSPDVTVKQGNGPRDYRISIRGSNARNGLASRAERPCPNSFPRAFQCGGFDLRPRTPFGDSRCSADDS